MKFLLIIDKEVWKAKIKPNDYSDVWILTDEEKDKYVEAINNFQDNLMELSPKGEGLK